MDQWVSYLHWTFQQEPVLISPIRLHSFSSFIAASLLTICVCVGERCLSRLLDNHWEPSFLQPSRWYKIIWRLMLNWVVTLLRLSYMLITMTFHIGLLLVIVTSLTATQSLLELLDHHSTLHFKEPGSQAVDSEELLLEDSSGCPKSFGTRSRSQFKQSGLFIHPTHSKFAREDAIALESEQSGSANRVHGAIYERAESTRSLLGSGRKLPEGSFNIRDGSDSD